MAPKNSEAISLEMGDSEEADNPKVLHFVLPVVLLIAATLFFEIDALKGAIVAVVFTIIYYGAERIMNVTAAMNHVFDGFKSMLFALAIIVFSFVLKDVNDQLGLAEYVMHVVSPWMIPEILPVVAFVSLAIITFSTGSFWGVYAISFPIIIPMAQRYGVDMSLALGAVVSAGAFGSHACFYGDATVLSSSASGCNNIAHVLSQLPYTLIAGVISAITFLILGYLMI